MGSRTGLDVFRGWKISDRDSNSGPFSPLCSRYANCALLVPVTTLILPSYMLDETFCFCFLDLGASHALVYSDTCLLFVTDIPDIPENIKNLRFLQVADFSSNPIPRYA